MKNSIERKEQLIPSFSQKHELLLPSIEFSLPQSLSDGARNWLSQCYKAVYGGEKNSGASASQFLNYISTFQQEMGRIESELISDRNVSVTKEFIEDLSVNIVRPAGRELRNSPIIIHFSDDNVFLGKRLLTTPVYIASELGLSVVVPRYGEWEAVDFESRLKKTLALYVAMQKHANSGVGLLGESIGASTAASLVVLAFQNSIPSPLALGLLSIGGLTGDSNHIYSWLDVSNLRNLSKLLSIGGREIQSEERLMQADDPVLKPINSNMQIFPPTVLLTGSRDVNLSSTVIYHRELRRANVAAKLHIYEELPHLFYLNLELVEARSALGRVCDFFRGEMGV